MTISPCNADQCTEWGWVTVRPGVVRPAYRSPSRGVTYSPCATRAWEAAPEPISASWVHRYHQCEGWKPSAVPDGYTVGA